jgi:hypothetical protein
LSRGLIRTRFTLAFLDHDARGKKCLRVFKSLGTRDNSIESSLSRKRKGIKEILFKEIERPDRLQQKGFFLKGSKREEQTWSFPEGTFEIEELCFRQSFWEIDIAELYRYPVDGYSFFGC